MEKYGVLLQQYCYSINLIFEPKYRCKLNILL